MQIFIQFLYTYSNEISIISGIISILSAIGTVISYLKIKITRDFSEKLECRCELPKFHKAKRYKVFARHKKQQRKPQPKQNEVDVKNLELLLEMMREPNPPKPNNNITQENSCNNKFSNDTISNNKIVLKDGSNTTVAVICFFGFLSLTVICATICAVVYLLTH